MFSNCAFSDGGNGVKWVLRVTFGAVEGIKDVVGFVSFAAVESVNLFEWKARERGAM